MIDLNAQYRALLTTPAAAAAMIPDGARVALALGAGAPPLLLHALADGARAGAARDIRFYYMLCTAIVGRTIFDPQLTDRLIPMSYFHSGVERGLDKGRTQSSSDEFIVDYIPSHFSQIPRSMVEHVGVDTLIATVSPMDDEGFFSLGTNTDYAMAVARKPGARLILEVNRHMPRVRGDCRVPLADVAALIEGDTPLCTVPTAPLSPTDTRIGEIIAGLVDDGACLQMGIGALPDAVCAGLHHHRRLGIHTELITPGLAELVRRGVADNSAKQTHTGTTIFTFALGDRALYDFIDDNPAAQAFPVEYVNNPAVIARNDRVVSVNATTQVDFHGACNSEFVAGRQFSGTGGQVDFVRGAYMSAGGKSIIACHSTAAGGTISRITPRLSGPVTTSRNDTHLVVTEYGVADMKGKTLAERAQALIAIAHPDFREDLYREAHALRLAGHD
ncbi:acetyl-CoA hydrolase/transferase family protein [Novosphingobium sp. KACC 22771]|uniref:acetyl-CoA hydrolase/transferase family protein n=1 Tax=Novosphingobium sp. KACC 22771 TaxID=3025670 RepID=UPI002365BB64|nr:acetyl-CoA hydrolase/transferase C-terminal domain-containing protein [Novosphingobium sp. KACC 22771]WDF74009.1 acetyl-CoA hydrolase/transferase C-terminal domain-containing protein [Novosphingobium sp. KACC 22771]